MFRLSFLFILLLSIPTVTQATIIIQPKDTLYRCKLQWIYENHLEQFRFNEPKTLTCVYRCQGFSSHFRWLEKQSPKGCKFNKTLHKT